MRLNKYSLSMTLDEYLNERKDETTIEWCSFCGRDVVIPVCGISTCPVCGNPILPCSMCDSDIVDCLACVWEDDEVRERMKEIGG